MVFSYIVVIIWLYWLFSWVYTLTVTIYLFADNFVHGTGPSLGYLSVTSFELAMPARIWSLDPSKGQRNSKTGWMSTTLTPTILIIILSQDWLVMSGKRKTKVYKHQQLQVGNPQKVLDIPAWSEEMWPMSHWEDDDYYERPRSPYT